MAGGVAGGARWLVVPVLALTLGVGRTAAADLEAAWDAQLRGRLRQAQFLLESDPVPTTPAHRLALAGVALELGDLDRARSALQPLVEDTSHPGFAGAALLLGRLHLAAGRHDEARSAFSASLERSADGPYAPAAHLALIRLDVYSGSFEELDDRLYRLAALGSSPELEMALDLLNPSGEGAPVRPYPSPLGLFEAARLADGLVPASLPALSVVRSAAGALSALPEPSAGQAGRPRNLVPMAPRTARGGPRYTLRIGSFRDPINARHMANALRDAELPVSTRQSGDLLEVLVGAVATYQAAALLLNRVQEIGYDGDVIPYRADSDP